MRLNQGIEWAVHACTLLAPLWPDTGLSLAALAEFHGVPAPYMAKQMQLLSKAEIVRASRGKTGGYALARPPAEITLWDITRALDGPAPLFRCTEIRQQGPCGAVREDCRKPCGIAAAFARAEMAWREVLQGVSVAELLVSAGAATNPARLEGVFSWMRANVTRLPGSTV